MISQERLKNILGNIPAPGKIRTLEKMNILRDVKLTGNQLDVTLANTASGELAQTWLKGAVSNVAQKNAGISDVNVSFIDVKPAEMNDIKNIIAVMSGKGGVGKSLVSSLAAIALRRKGFEVGILDADITGPSIPKMFGINTRPSGSDTGILPVLSSSDIEIISVNLFLPGEEEAVIWRGPMISNAITQFWQDVVWGKLDYLIIDLPPGTADAPLTVLQKLPVNGIIMVFTPQNLTTMIVRKAINMAKVMKKPIVGVVENMSYLYLPEIDKKMNVFGESKGQTMAELTGTPLLAQIPIDPELARLCDQGEIEKYRAAFVDTLAESISKIDFPPSAVLPA
jgi:Mrp family chromosome partitioning ATPase